MLKGLVIFAIFAVGIAVGCSQQDGTAAIVAPEDTSVPSVAGPTPTDVQDASSPAPTSATVAEAPETPAAPASASAPRRGGFVPLDDPIFLAADETKYFGDEELVLGVEFAGEVRAYPVRMLRYHHIVNDTVGGEPLLVTY